MSWTRLEAEAPAIAAAGRRLIFRGPVGKGLLSTVRDGAPPRIHPVWVAIAAGRLVVRHALGEAR